MVSKTKTTNSSIIDELKDAVVDYQKASSVAAQQKVKKLQNLKKKLKHF